MWGDSLVHGGCDAEMGGWVTRLKLYLWRRGLGDHAFNLGLGGNNSTDLVARLRPELEARRNHIDHVMISVGVNDVMAAGVTPEDYQANLESLLATVRSFGKTAHLLTMTLMLGKVGRSEKFNDVIAQVAAAQNVRLLKMQGCLCKTDLVDYVHPNAAGHEKIFQWVKAYLIREAIIPSVD